MQVIILSVLIAIARAMAINEPASAVHASHVHFVSSPSDSNGAFSTDAPPPSYEEHLQTMEKNFSSCSTQGGINVTCYYSELVELQSLTQDYSALAKGEDSQDPIYLKLQRQTIPKMNLTAERECEKHHDFSSDCVHFNFKDYTDAWEYLKITIRRLVDDLVNNSYEPDTPIKTLYEGYLYEKAELNRLEVVSTDQWRQEPDFTHVQRLRLDCNGYMASVIASLKIRGIEV